MDHDGQKFLTLEAQAYAVEALAIDCDA